METDLGVCVCVSVCVLCLRVFVFVSVWLCDALCVFVFAYVWKGALKAPVSNKSRGLHLNRRLARQLLDLE